MWSSTNNRLVCATDATGASTFTSIVDADGDTGIQVEAAADEDKIRFNTAGAERMIINELGNVGIGTNDPQSKFHAVGNSGADAAGIIEASSGQSSSLKLGPVTSWAF